MRPEADDLHSHSTSPCAKVRGSNISFINGLSQKLGSQRAESTGDWLPDRSKGRLRLILRAASFLIDFFGEAVYLDPKDGDEKGLLWPGLVEIYCRAD